MNKNEIQNKLATLRNGAYTNITFLSDIIPNKDIRLDITYQEQRGTIFRINPKK